MASESASHWPETLVVLGGPVSFLLAPLRFPPSRDRGQRESAKLAVGDRLDIFLPGNEILRFPQQIGNLFGVNLYGRSVMFLSRSGSSTFKLSAFSISCSAASASSSASNCLALSTWTAFEGLLNYSLSLGLACRPSSSTPGPHRNGRRQVGVSVMELLVGKFALELVAKASASAFSG